MTQWMEITGDRLLLFLDLLNFFDEVRRGDISDGSFTRSNPWSLTPHRYGARAEEVFRILEDAVGLSRSELQRPHCPNLLVDDAGGAYSFLFYQRPDLLKRCTFSAQFFLGVLRTRPFHRKLLHLFRSIASGRITEATFGDLHRSKPDSPPHRRQRSRSGKRTTRVPST